MNKNQEKSDGPDSKFADDEIDMYTLSEDQLWTRSELEEMRKPKSSQTKKSSSVHASVKTDAVGGERNTVSKKASRAKSQGTNSGGESRPDFYHGVGPFNDINLPGVWFFRIPHKV